MKNNTNELGATSNYIACERVEDGDFVSFERNGCVRATKPGEMILGIALNDAKKRETVRVLLCNFTHTEGKIKAEFDYTEHMLMFIAQIVVTLLSVIAIYSITKYGW